MGGLGSHVGDKLGDFISSIILSAPHFKALNKTITTTPFGFGSEKAERSVFKSRRCCSAFRFHTCNRHTVTGSVLHYDLLTGTQHWHDASSYHRHLQDDLNPLGIVVV